MQWLEHYCRDLRFTVVFGVVASSPSDMVNFLIPMDYHGLVREGGGCRRLRGRLRSRGALGVLSPKGKNFRGSLGLGWVRLEVEKTVRRLHLPPRSAGSVSS